MKNAEIEKRVKGEKVKIGRRVFNECEELLEHERICRGDHLGRSPGQGILPFHTVKVPRLTDIRINTVGRMTPPYRKELGLQDKLLDDDLWWACSKTSMLFCAAV
jgi:hypothetical protein